MGWGSIVGFLAKLFAGIVDIVRNQQLISAGRDKQRADEYEKVEEFRREEDRIDNQPVDDPDTLRDELLKK